MIVIKYQELWDDYWLWCVK